MKKISSKAAEVTAETSIKVRYSKIHGRGVFAVRKIAAGTRIIEYTGELISEAEGERRYPTLPDGNEEPEHTYLLTLDAERVIDANVGGNAARFINHSCEPNCEPIAFGDQMWIVAIRAIQPSILFLGGDRLLAIGRSRQNKVFEVESADGGTTWKPMTLGSLPNPNSGTDALMKAIALSDARLAQDPKATDLRKQAARDPRLKNVSLPK